MQKARRHRPEGRLRPLVSARFQVLLTALIGVLFNFQSPYCFAIGRQVVFSLGGWSLLFHTGFHEPRITLGTPSHPFDRLQDYHLLWSSFQIWFIGLWDVHVGARNPGINPGLGCSVFARRY